MVYNSLVCPKLTSAVKSVSADFQAAGHFLKSHFLPRRSVQSTPIKPTTIRLIDRAAQQLSKTPLIVIIGPQEDKMISAERQHGASEDGFAVRISKNWI